VTTLAAVASVLLALAAVPTALAAGGTAGGHARIAQLAERFTKRCGSSSAAAPQRRAGLASKHWLGSSS
jgi:hypothetical protein